MSKRRKTAADYVDADGWFSEAEVLWNGQKLCLKVQKVLADTRTDFQHVLIFDSESYGRVLVLDGIVQLTERDEFAYQEMIAHVPFYAHAGTPKRALVIGGGDGGVVRELCKHEELTEIVHVEIDPMCIELCKQYFPTTLATAMLSGDSRYKCAIRDGNEFLRENVAKFDIIVVDSSDPIGPNVSLFVPEFYDLLKKSLNEGGVVCAQAEDPWVDLELTTKLVSRMRAVFEQASFAYTCVPTYPCGQIGFAVAVVGEGDVRTAHVKGELPAGLKYYTPQMHAASFVLPKFAKDALDA